MKFWFDADNAPHVLVMGPIAEELTRKGHEVLFTARDRSRTCELLDLHGIPYISTRTERPSKHTFVKILWILQRTLELAKKARHWEIDLSFGHGSRSLPIASSMVRVPSVTMYDYEWVNPGIFNKFCKAIILPKCISDERIAEASIDRKRVIRFNGYKEELYLSRSTPDQGLSRSIGLREDSLKVLLRPPASDAHYHNSKADILLEILVTRLLEDHRVQIVWIPRDSTPEALSRKLESHSGRVFRLNRFCDGPSLIREMDLVIGGGGTMTREAAILGVRSISFFMGHQGSVDDSLVEAGRLELIREEGDANKFRICPDKGDVIPVKIRSELAQEIAGMLCMVAEQGL